MRPVRQHLSTGQPFKQIEIFGHDANPPFYSRGSASRSRPSTLILPLVGPAAGEHFIVVDLPAPFGPKSRRSCHGELQVNMIDCP